MSAYRLLYKDIRLSIHPFFFILPVLTGALLLVPQWPYFIAFMYFFWISIPTIVNTLNAQNDYGFSVMMPVSKGDIVKGKILSFILLELLHLVFAAIFALIHARIYHVPNFLLNPNMAFFGFAFTIYALFNLVFFPLYFRTAYQFGLPTIVGTVVTLAFAAGVETLAIYYPTINRFLEGPDRSMRLIQLAILIMGILVFTGLSYLAIVLSKARYEKVDV